MNFQQSNLTLSLYPTGGEFKKLINSKVSSDNKFWSAAPGYLIQNTMQTKTNTTQTVYLIDSTHVTGNEVFVVYSANEKDLEGTISLSDLKQFALNHSLNDFIFDTFYNGEHEQDEVTENIDTFLAENLETGIKAYYEAYPLESVLNEIAMLKLVIA